MRQSYQFVIILRGVQNNGGLKRKQNNRAWNLKRLSLKRHDNAQMTWNKMLMQMNNLEKSPFILLKYVKARLFPIKYLQNKYWRWRWAWGWNHAIEQVVQNEISEELCDWPGQWCHGCCGRAVQVAKSFVCAVLFIFSSALNDGCLKPDVLK